MKKLSFSMFNIIAVFLIILSVILIVLPFNLINLEQAERIAKWKSEFEQLKYCFSLVNLHEGSIVPTNEEAGVVVSDEYIQARLKPYFNISETNDEFSKYSYKKMNGRKVDKLSQFSFNKFFTEKNGTILSIKQNTNDVKDINLPLYFMFVDINGLEKPNRIGQDIFFINIFRDKVDALGNTKPFAKLKANCSPIGSGLYCSEYYLLGGRF